MSAALLLAGSLWVPPSSLAAQGDCSQPVSDGEGPTSSDCLFILTAAIGAEVCDPTCICDPGGDGETTATDALLCLQKAVGQDVALDCQCPNDTTTTTIPTTSGNTVTIHVIDADSGADVVGALVEATPGNETATTDTSGRATFSNLPAWPYEFTASARGLTLSGSSIVPDTTQTATSDPIPVIADATLWIDLKLPRVDPALNLVTLHTGGHETYTKANCQACHNDRKDELSYDALVAPFHALTMHSSLSCTFCHQTVDLENDSGAAIRKQVDVTTTCKGCHPSYPASF